MGFRKVGMGHLGVRVWHSELCAVDKVGLAQELDSVTLEGFAKSWGSGIVGLQVLRPLEWEAGNSSRANTQQCPNSFLACRDRGCSASEHLGLG